VCVCMCAASRAYDLTAAHLVSVCVSDVCESVRVYVCVCVCAASSVYNLTAAHLVSVSVLDV